MEGQETVIFSCVVEENLNPCTTILYVIALACNNASGDSGVVCHLL